MTSKKDYFISMYSLEATRIAQPFLVGEYLNLFKAINYFPDKYSAFVVVGCGPAVYFKFSQDNSLKYVGIEPELESFKHEILSIMHNKELGALFFKRKLERIKDSNLDLLPSPKIVLFAFNIANYIPSFKFQLARLVRSGDLVIVSSWLRTPVALNVRKRYFNYLNGISAKQDVIDHTLRINLTKLDLANFSLKFKKKVLNSHANSCLVLKMGES